MQRAFSKEKEVQQLQIAQEKAAVEDLQARVRRFWIWGILIVISIGFAVTLRLRSLRFRQQSLRDLLQIKATQAELIQKKLAQEQLANENLELKIALKQQDLVNFALDNQRKRELLQHLARQLKKLKPGQVTQATVNTIINDMILQTQTEIITRQYEENIDVVNAEYKSKLLKRFPELSASDLELCGMIRLGMQAKEIASFRNVTENAILVARKRLRKKLNIETGVDLRSFLSD
jgi:DNA-binding NarL/FixJ family response regulator